MDHAVIRVLVDSPYRPWIDAVVDSWQRLTANSDLSWSGELRRHGHDRFEEPRFGGEQLPTLFAELRDGIYDTARLTGSRGGVVGVVLSMDLRINVSGKPGGDALFERLFPSLPDTLEGARLARCITMSIPSEGAPLLEPVLRDLFTATDACWAQLGIQAHPPSPFGPAMRAWREWAPLVRDRAPEAASHIVLGPGHIEALGGMEHARRALDAFELDELETTTGRVGLHVATAPTAMPGDDARVAALAAALAPILLQAPMMPAPGHILSAEQVDSALPEIDGVSVRRLADGTVVLEAGKPHRRDDHVGGQRAADAQQRVYKYLATLGLPRRIDRGRRAEGEILCLPRFLGDTNFWRYAPSLIVHDTGEPITNPLPFAVHVTGKRRAQLVRSLAELVADRVARAGCECNDDHLGCELPGSAASGQPLLELLLAIDRAVAAFRGANGLGVVLGRVPTADEIVDRAARGEWFGLGGLPR